MSMLSTTLHCPYPLSSNEMCTINTIQPLTVKLTYPHLKATPYIPYNHHHLYYSVYIYTTYQHKLKDNLIAHDI